jgi:hypothetical protein
MQQAHLSSQTRKRRPLPPRDPQAQTSQPIQPLKLAQRQRVEAPPEPPISSSYPQGVVVPIAAPQPVRLPDRSSTATLTQPVTANCPIEKPRKPRKPWEWALIGLVAVAGTFGGIGTAAVLWLSSLPEMPKCEDVTLRSLDVQRLFCAQEAAHSGRLSDLVAGIHLLQNWESDHPLKQEAQRLISNWSDSILTIAQTQINQNDMKGAVATAQKIPTSSPKYAEAQAAIKHWQTQWKTGEATVKTAQLAMQQQDWTKASKQVLTLGLLEHAYWRLQRADELSRQIVDEKEARQFLIAAQRVAKIGQPQELGEAIALLRKVPIKTYASHDADMAQKQWSKALLALAIQQWQQGNANGAMGIAQKIPFSNDLSSEGQDLVRFSQAQDLAGASRRGWEPNLAQSWQLMEAIAALQQISPKSFFYRQAQISAQKWQSELNQLNQLQLANWVAEWGQRPQLEFAMIQAQEITPKSPHRTLAQSMLSRWRRAVETIDDRPYMAEAKQTAKSGTLENLRLAIAQASRVALGRALRTESQTYIAQWKKQLETLEDQPILAQAEALAAKGDMTQAMDKAAQIKVNRALYGEAQAAIARWQPQVEWQPAAIEPPAQLPVQALAEPGSARYPLGVAAPEPQWTAPEAIEPALEATVPEATVPEAASEAEPIAPEPPAAIENPPAASIPAASYEGFYDERYFNGTQ